MISVGVVIQSLEDAANGKPILEGVPIENYTRADEMKIGILEAGMQSGKTSLMFVLRNGDKVHYSEISAAQFEFLVGAVRGAVERFKK